MNKRILAASAIAMAFLLVVVGCVYIGNLRPVASFTATPMTGNTPLDVDFDASASSDADGTIATYAWDFGDGQTASVTIATISHQFVLQSDSETYRVVLTVTDDGGATDQVVVDITVDP